MKKRVLTLLLLLLVFGIPQYAQDDLEETLSNLSTDAARSYVFPAVNGFGANLNSGWFDYAPAAVQFKPTDSELLPMELSSAMTKKDSVTAVCSTLPANRLMNF